MTIVLGLITVPGFASSDSLAVYTYGRYNAPVLDSGSTLDDYILHALAASPSLKAAYHRWEAAVQQAPQAGALPEPRLGYGYFLRQVETRVGPQVQRFGIQQAFPWFGKLGLAESRANGIARAAARQFDSDRLELIRRVRTAYHGYWLLGRRIEITRANLALLEQTEELISNRYSTGNGGFSQLIKVQVEMGRLEDGIATLEELASARAASLNALLGRDTGLPLPFPSSIDTSGAMDHDSDAELAVRNPRLARLRELQRAAEDGVSLAGKQRWPDIMLGLDYIQTDESTMPNVADNGKDPLIASISINLPLSFGKYDAAREQAAGSLNALREQEIDLERKLRAEYSQAVVDLDDARRKAALYGGTLIPKAEQALDASISALATGGADALDVLDSQRTLLSFQLEHERALAAIATARADIDALVADTQYLDRATQAQTSGGN